MCLIKIMCKRVFRTVAALALSVLSVVVSLRWNAILMSMIDSVNTGGSLAAQSVIGAAAIITLAAAVSFAARLCASLVSETMAHDLRMGYARYFAFMPVKEAEKQNAGKQLSKLQNEISGITEYLCENLFPLIDDLIRFTATFIWLSQLNLNLTLLANAPVILIMLYTVCTSKIISEAALQSQEAKSNMNRFVDTAVSIFPILRVFAAERFILDKYIAVAGQWEKAASGEERKRARLMSLSAFMSYIPIILLFLIGGSQVIEGVMTLGQLYIFINLSGNISGIMMNMPSRAAMFRRFAVNIKRLSSMISV